MGFYQFDLSKGYAYSAGSGFGADSISGEGYHNVPEGFAYLRNLIYREDGILRPFFANSNLGATVGTGGIYGVFGSKDSVVYAIAQSAGNPKVHESTNEGTTFAEVTDSSGGAVLPITLQYRWADYSKTSTVFKNDDVTSPTYIIQEA